MAALRSGRVMVLATFGLLHRMTVPRKSIRVVLIAVLGSGLALVVGNGGPTATSSPSATGLFSVSCTSPTECFAVGFSFDGVGSTSAALAEKWSGTKWTIRPCRIRLARQRLNSTGCHAPPHRHALRSAITQPLSEVSLPDHSPSGGTVRHGQSNPHPSPLVRLTSNSPEFRVALVSCTAVGYSFANSRSSLLAEKWNGANGRSSPLPSRRARPLPTSPVSRATRQLRVLQLGTPELPGWLNGGMVRTGPSKPRLSPSAPVRAHFRPRRAHCQRHVSP